MLFYPSTQNNFWLCPCIEASIVGEFAKTNYLKLKENVNIAMRENIKYGMKGKNITLHYNLYQI